MKCFFGPLFWSQLSSCFSSCPLLQYSGCFLVLVLLDNDFLFDHFFYPTFSLTCFSNVAPSGFLWCDKKNYLLCFQLSALCDVEIPRSRLWNQKVTWRRWRERGIILTTALSKNVFPEFLLYFPYLDFFSQILKL